MRRWMGAYVSIIGSLLDAKIVKDFPDRMKTTSRVCTLPTGDEQEMAFVLT